MIRNQSVQICSLRSSTQKKKSPLRPPKSITFAISRCVLRLDDSRHATQAQRHAQLAREQKLLKLLKQSEIRLNFPTAGRCQAPARHPGHARVELRSSNE